LRSGELTQILVSLALLLACAHAFGYLFARLRQPRVIGEIVGGLVLGPTALSALFPGTLAWIFPRSGPAPAVLAAVTQIGLLLLMFASGAEIRPSFRRGERKTVALITTGGLIAPFVLGVLLASMIHTRSLQGAAHNRPALSLVFGIAVAVTSIPVISRIMFDLGILHSAFARIVLAAAIAEDIVLYVVLAIALGMVQAQQGAEFGLPALIGLKGGSSWSLTYHSLASVSFLALAATLGPRLYARSLRSRFNVIGRNNRTAYDLFFLLLMTLLCLFFAVTPIFGAFLAGLIVRRASLDASDGARASITKFSFAFLIPIYFAVVGLRLDLLHHLNIVFFFGFLVFACGAKALGVYGGARLGGQSSSGARNLAVAMNARGGPGIVLASVALDAAIVSREFYTTLVLVAIVTSLVAGTWLERTIRRGAPLLEADLPPAAAEPSGSSNGQVEPMQETPPLSSRAAD
jgi:Kef-type K+ transport system membrane component KefB